MTEFKRAWRNRAKTRRAAEMRRWLKRQNTRKNRRVGKQLENYHIKLDAWVVI